MNVCWILLNALSVSIDIIADRVDCIDLFSNVEQALNAYNKFHFVMVYNYFTHFRFSLLTCG